MNVGKPCRAAIAGLKPCATLLSALLGAHRLRYPREVAGRTACAGACFACSARIPYEIVTFTLPIDGEVQLARWLHPNETPKVVTQEHVDALRAFLREGDVAIDIGAHTGDTSLPMALAVGRGGAVFALEPNLYVFKTVLGNRDAQSDKARIVPLMFAAMPNDGEFEFEYSDSGYCNGGFHHAINRWKHGHFFQLRVTGRNLADYLRKEAPTEIPRIRFVKIDTEGYDRTVVQSLASISLPRFGPTSKPKSTGIFQPASGSGPSTICDNWVPGVQVRGVCASWRGTRAGGPVSLEALRRLRRASRTSVMAQNFEPLNL